MAPRAQLRIEPYNPNAFDADNDGIVQEGTAWERPVGTRLIGDAFGAVIEAGRTSTVRPSSLRVVDNSGNQVAYVPSYQRKIPSTPSGRPTGGLTLGDKIGTLGQRYGTLGDKLPSLGDRQPTLGDKIRSIGTPRPSSSIPLTRDVVEARTGLMSLRDRGLRRMTPDQVNEQNRISATVNNVLDKAKLASEDRSTVQALALGGAYWVTFLGGGGQIGSMINDFTTGVGDANLTEQLDTLWQMYAVGGIAGLQSSIGNILGKTGISQEQINQFFADFGDLMDWAKVSAGNLSQQILRVLQEIFDALASLVGRGSGSSKAAVLIEFKARPLRIEPYNPDAFDGDNDGIVQERTAWERPAGTRIVNDIGQEIVRGMISPKRSKKNRVVDAEGNTVDYTPTYDKEKPAKPFNILPNSPINKLRSVQQARRGSPAAETPKKFDPPTFTSPMFGQVLIGNPQPTTILIDKESGRYIKERRKLHKAIVAWHLQRASVKQQKSKDKKTVYWLGGGGGAGKTSAFEAGTINIPTDLLRADPDEIKTMIPEYREWLYRGDGRSADLVHDESKHIFESTVHGLVELDSDFVYDTTGNGSYDKMVKKIDDLKRRGHEVKARYLTISLEEAILRAEKREAETGRLVPRHQLIHNHQEVSTNVIRAISDGLFDDLELYDNQGEEARLILKAEGGKVKVLDPVAVRDFMYKSPSLARSPGPSPAGAFIDLDEARSKQSQIDKTLLPQIVSAKNDYITDGYQNINYLLRSGGDDLDDFEYDEAAIAINRLDYYFDQASFVSVKPVVLYRGTVEYVPEDLFDGDPAFVPDLDKIDALELGPIGSKFAEDAFSSTTMTEKVAQSFAFGEMGTDMPGFDDGVPVALVMEVTIPPGVRMIHGNTAEKELILERGLRYKVMGYEVRYDPAGRPYRVIKTVAKPPFKKPEEIPLSERDLSVE